MENMSEFDDETIKQIKNIFAPFYEVIKEVRMNELRKELLREQIQPFQFRAKCGSAIEAHSLLESAEKEQWEQIYGEVKEEQAQQENIPECKKCQLRREQPST
ncbi:18109_t:CDS:2 [Cetraspora pellucida]|uniref:18109_t:CDS:1 n=1 Tax=Cetraspora pellucida TaxID=1433469 RepID=A0ACA9K073_9GLOM|nr:18109_t:CDS:2 [Cetraspora pellucida]